jgi:GNAT superfamily N-acetyltransferase
VRGSEDERPTGRRSGNGAAIAHVLEDDEVRRAASVIARAFHDDPLNVYLYPDDRERTRLAPQMFEALVRYDHLFGRVDRLLDFVAVATWQLPGETTETQERLAQAGFDDLPDEVPLERLGAVFDVITAAIERIAPEPHWHLRLLAVDPGRQSGGLGANLLQDGLRRADASGRPVLLETFAERTVPFYCRNGFEVIVDDVEPTSGLRFWALRYGWRSQRDPASLA